MNETTEKTVSQTQLLKAIIICLVLLILGIVCAEYICTTPDFQP